MSFEGVMTALVTPLDNENEVDGEKLKDLIEFQIKNGVDSLVFLGGTGEYSSLSVRQRKLVIDLAIQYVDGRVPVVIGLIDPGIGDTMDMGVYAKQSGADALMIVTPFYVNPTQQGLIDYYKKLDSTLDMPIILYNIPHKTGVNMLPSTVEKIVNETSNVVGIKECTENFGQMIQLINLVGDQISVLAGEEFAAVASMIFGAKGCVMASANVVPQLWTELYQLIKDGKYDEAINKNKEFESLFYSIFKEPNPGPLKTALEMKGFTDKTINLPLLEPSHQTKEVLQKLSL